MLEMVGAKYTHVGVGKDHLKHRNDLRAENLSASKCKRSGFECNGGKQDVTRALLATQTWLPSQYPDSSGRGCDL